MKLHRPFTIIMVLIVSTAIIAFLFFLIISFEGQSSARKQFEQVVEQTEKQYTAADIKAAVMPLFLKFQNGDDIPFNQLPKEITSLQIFNGNNVPEKDIFCHFADSNTKDILMIDAGGGFEHHGIFICRSELTGKQDILKHFDKNAMFLVPWEDGIYFYSIGL